MSDLWGISGPSGGRSAPDIGARVAFGGQLHGPQPTVFWKFRVSTMSFTGGRTALFAGQKLELSFLSIQNSPDSLSSVGVGLIDINLGGTTASTNYMAAIPPGGLFTMFTDSMAIDPITGKPLEVFDASQFFVSGITTGSTVSTATIFVTVGVLETRAA